MTREEFLERLRSVEWNDIEFKEATWASPKNALPTVSAFANTRGGYLVYGVTEAGGSLSISGVIDVEKIQNDFLGITRDMQKVSVALPISEELLSFPEGTVICFYIPEADRRSKPVYLDRDIRKAYIRKGSGDYACNQNELHRFIRDAGNAPFDSETLDIDPEKFFDEQTLTQYRTILEASAAGRSTALSNSDFLRRWGFLVERDGAMRPTRAAIYVLGADEYVRQILPRLVVDFQAYHHKFDEYDPNKRWNARITVEENLMKAWAKMLEFYQRNSDVGFSLDSSSLRRHDDPPDYISFREAAINLLVHQDFGDYSRKPEIRFFKDSIEFFNPGDAFVSREQLLDPGGKEVRNPNVVNAFRRIGLSEQAGSGVGAIFESWRRLGFIPPEIDNDKGEKSFRLRLRRERLVTQQQILAQASLGAQLSSHEAAVFAYLTRTGEIDIADVKALTGLSGPDVRQLVQRLRAQVILRPSGGADDRFFLEDHLRDRFLSTAGEKNTSKQQDSSEQSVGGATVQVTEQVLRDSTEQVQVLKELTSVQWVIIEHADAPRSLAELLTATGYTQRPFFKATHLQPLLDGRILRMTVPDKPTSSKQRYVLTEAGLTLKSLRLDYGTATAKKEKNE